ncbi:hypothetical protein Pmani_029092 [Petrolisthes manimaculis]|uniref:Uncharacterized protein n=1 Tax=Petrolisthes manimaculis TaxID=1843537 RepID=A0AAE1P0W8_9EUCA|nr:hypothetical protein Pmani_029092 [Petrolisthes manimaculis]
MREKQRVRDEEGEGVNVVAEAGGGGVVVVAELLFPPRYHTDAIVGYWITDSIPASPVTTTHHWSYWHSRELQLVPHPQLTP